jgi:hypothetical protein
VIPGGVVFLSGLAFGNETLQLISFSPLSPNFTVKGKMVQDVSGGHLIRYFGHESEFEIANTIEVICEGCFANCKWLTMIKFESDSKLSRIDKKAFFESGLKSLRLPASVQVICKACFSGCRALESISFESDSKLLQIGHSAFSGTKLRSIHHPASVLMISEWCFSWGKSLESISFESNSKFVPNRTMRVSCEWSQIDSLSRLN